MNIVGTHGVQDFMVQFLGNRLGQRKEGSNYSRKAGVLGT